MAPAPVRQWISQENKLHGKLTKLQLHWDEEGAEALEKQFFPMGGILHCQALNIQMRNRLIKVLRCHDEEHSSLRNHVARAHRSTMAALPFIKAPKASLQIKEWNDPVSYNLIKT